MLEPVRPGAVSPNRALYLQTFSHFVVVNKTSLSLSLSSPGRSEPHIASVYPCQRRSDRPTLIHALASATGNHARLDFIERILRLFRIWMLGAKRLKPDTDSLFQYFLGFE